MKDENKTKKQLIADLTQLRRQVAELSDNAEKLKEVSKSHEKFFRSFTHNSIPVGITTLKEGRFVEVSEAFLKLMGLKRDHVIGNTPSGLGLITDEQRKLFFRELGKKGRIENLELPVKVKGGKTRYGLFNAVLMNISNEKYLQTVMTDITERKLLEEALVASEKKYKAIFENAVEGIFQTSREGRILNANPSLARIYGFDSPQEMMEGLNDIGSRLYADPADRRRILAIIDRKGSIRGAEIRQKKRDGSIFWASLSGRKVCDENGQTLFYEGTILDATDRIEAENSLQESKSFTQGILETTPSLIYIYDLAERRNIYVNKEIAGFLGYTPKQLRAMGSDLFRTILHPEDASAVARHHALLAASEGVEVLETDYRMKHANGRWRWLRSRDIPYKWDRDGNVTQILGSAEDITDRKRAEEEKQLQQELLVRMERMDALGVMAGGIAHHLNNMLGIVVGYSEMLLDRIDASSPLKEDIARIMDGGERASALVQDLLIMARRGPLAKKTLNLNHAILESLSSPEFLNLSYRYPSVELKTDLEESITNISASPLHIEKTLKYLLANAAEAIQNAGVIRIRTFNAHLDKPLRGHRETRKGDYAALEVSDTGEPVSSGDMKHIFEPFYARRMMGRKEGTGLGLSVVWGTVKDHDGYIEAAGRKGRGTSFTLYFPATREETPDTWTRQPVSGELRGNREKVLVVDDEPAQRDLAVRMLTKLNYEVHSVSGGEEAVEYLRSRPVDLLILDMIMEPGIDGLETYRRVIEIRPAQKAVIVSGFTETERVTKAQELGAGVFLKKPYLIEQLASAVRCELDRRKV